MRIFVTGASGWIGSAVVPELLGAGHVVIGLGDTDQGGDAARFMGILRESSHEGQIDVNVWIDKAGKNQFATGVDGFRPRRRVKILADAGNGLILDKNVGPFPRPDHNDFTVLDQQCHRTVPCSQ